LPPPLPPATAPAVDAEETFSAQIKKARETIRRAFRPEGQSWEQWIGSRWMLFVGVGIVLLGGAFFFKYAYDQGWINPTRRCIIGGIWGLAMIALGEWFLRQKMRLFAAAISGAGIVWLYKTAHAASPQGLYNLVSPTAAFVLMCVVTLIGVGLSLRGGMLATALIALLGALATPVLLRTGVDRQTLLMTYMLVVDAGFLAVALAKRWVVLAPLALAGTVLLFAGWHGSHFHAAAQVARTVGFGWGLLGVFVAYVCVDAVFDRGAQGLAAVLMAVSSTAMALLLLVIMGQVGLAPSATFGNLLALVAAMLALCLWRRWDYPAIYILALAASVLLGWRFLCFAPPAGAVTVAGLWGIVGLFAVYACVADVLKRTNAWLAGVLIGGAAATVVLLWLGLGFGDGPLFGQLLALNAMVLAVCHWRRWPWLRAGVLAWTAVAVLHQWGNQAPLAGAARLPWSVWVWAFYGLTIADVVLWARRKGAGVIERLDATISTAATAMMFWATYALLRPNTGDAWMGVYAAGLGGAIIALAWWVHRSASRRELAHTFVGQGLVLLTLAAPIAFDRSPVTIVWAVQGVVAMLLACRLKSRMLLVKSLAVLFLAVDHFFAQSLPHDPRLANALLTIAGVDITYGFALAIGLTGAILAAAGILRGGAAITCDQDDRYLAVTVALVWCGALFFAFRCCAELPTMAATWGWWALAAGLAGVALWRRSAWLADSVCGMLLATAVKWLFNDTLGRRTGLGATALTGTPVANWQFAAGVALAVTVLLVLWGRRRRDFAAPPGVDLLGLVLSAVLIVWAGSFEVDRYFIGHGDRWADPWRAMHMGLSLWWGLCASATLILGFARAIPALRYFALALFALTIGKVFLADMRGVSEVYRVLSFLGLGVLLLAAAWLYHRSIKRLGKGA